MTTFDPATGSDPYPAALATAIAQEYIRLHCPAGKRGPAWRAFGRAMDQARAEGADAMPWDAPAKPREAPAITVDGFRACMVAMVCAVRAYDYGAHDWFEEQARLLTEIMDGLEARLSDTGSTDPPCPKCGRPKCPTPASCRQARYMARKLARAQAEAREEITTGVGQSA